MTKPKLLTLTKTDELAIEKGDYNYINTKGADLYGKEIFEPSAEYYHLAAAMGSAQAISNLGYCYLYGRHTEQNISLGLAYFKIAAEREVIDAAYKLGRIYEQGFEPISPDPELSLYYYRMAWSYFQRHKYEDDYDATAYPGLFFAMARATMPGGLMPTDIYKAFSNLVTAKVGYEVMVENGVGAFYQKDLDKVCELMKDKCFEPLLGLPENKDFDDILPTLREVHGITKPEDTEMDEE